MDRAVLIANPGASQFTGGLHRAALRTLSHRFDVVSLWPKDANDAWALAAAEAERGSELVIAMGGDGIVHHIAQGIVGTDTTLGIVPAGTTNVVARLSGIPSRPGAALRLLTGDFGVFRQPVLDLDLHRVDGTVDHRSAVFAAGAGLDAEVVRQAESEPYRKYRFGGVHYATTALSTVWSDLRRRHPSVTVAAGSHVADGIGFMAQFRDAYTYFGRVRLRLSPEPPSPMHVLVPSEIRIRRAASILLGAAVRGDLSRVRGFHVWERIGRISAVADEPMLVQADGELLGSAVRIEAVLRPEGLAVAVP
jgi:diacylglycerol kinase family enzyme